MSLYISKNRSMKSKHVINFHGYWIDLSKIECISEVNTDIETETAFVWIYLSKERIYCSLPKLEMIDEALHIEMCKDTGYFQYKDIRYDHNRIKLILDAYNNYVFSSLIHLWLTYDNEVREV